MYYGDLIRAAREGGMAAVRATEQYKERIAAYPPKGPYLMGPEPEHYIRVMSNRLRIFTSGPVAPVMGLREDQLRSIAVPTLVVPGNDKTHASVSSEAAARLIPGAELFELPIEDRDVALIPAGRRAQGRDRAPRRRDGKGAGLARDQERCRDFRLRARPGRPGRVRRVHARRDREVVQGHPGRQHQDRVAATFGFVAITKTANAAIVAAGSASSP